MSAQEPLILLTNDDGIESAGLWAAAEQLAHLGELWVVAPREQSLRTGRLSPLGAKGRIETRQYHIRGRDWQGFAVSGTPAQVVLHACHELLPRLPDVVVSAVNFGVTLGPGAMMAEAVRAAMEAAVLKAPALVVSLETGIEAKANRSGSVDFSAAAVFTLSFTQRMLQVGFPPDVNVLKIEIPSDATTATPWEVTRQSLEPYYLVQTPPARRLEEPGPLTFAIQRDTTLFAEGTDAHTVLVKRKVAVTPLSLDMTSRVDPVSFDEELRRSPE
jgi:5'-nucleotidase